MRSPSDVEQYLFDLRGYTVLRNALLPEHVAAIREWVENLPELTAGQWLGCVEVHSYREIDGMNLQHIFEAGEIFASLIDHPAWIDLVRHYLGPTARPSLHEMFLNLRGPGGYIGVHSGGGNINGRISAGIDRGQWCVQYMTLMLALDDVDSGDGATVIVPGSHKSALMHPRQSGGGGISSVAGGSVEGAEEIHLNAGDGLLFNDALLHGSAQRTNPGLRRMIVSRYLPHEYNNRWGYVPSEALLRRLTVEQREIVQPTPPRRAPEER